MLSKIFVSLTVLLYIIYLPAYAYAQEFSLDERLKELCNQVMMNIYDDILSQKDKYEELKDFDEKALYESKDGLIAIIYEYGPQTFSQNKVTFFPFRFGLAIEGKKENAFRRESGNFGLVFPFLGIKISGYQPGYFEQYMVRTRFYVMPLINKHGTLLHEYQQSLLPLRLFLEPAKQSFRMGESIEFDVVLMNVSKRHMYVNPLNQNMLSFSADGITWSAAVVFDGPGKSFVLKAGESRKAHVRGLSYNYPRELEITGQYLMRIKGVNPSSTTKIQIIGK